MDEGKTKRCRVCGEVRPLSDFYRQAGCKDGHRNDCRFCFQARLKKRADEQPELREQARERTRRWIDENREHYDAYKAEYRRTGRAKEPLRRAHLKAKYGLTVEQYDELLASQGGGCAVCGRTATEKRPLHVDHDHVSGRVRGILCFNCNVGIGSFQDSPTVMLAALEYLTRTRVLDWLAAMGLPPPGPQQAV
jgi:hypothetical protein